MKPAEFIEGKRQRFLAKGGYREALRSFQVQYFTNLLKWHGYSMTKVAEASGMERTHLYRLLRRIGVFHSPSRSAHEREKEPAQINGI